MTAKNLAKILSNYGIATRPFFYPMTNQKIFKQLKIFKKNRKYPNSEFISKFGLYLPSYFKMKNNDIVYIANIVNKVLR